MMAILMSRLLPPVLRIDEVQVGGNEAVLLQCADGCQIRLVLVRVSVCLANKSRFVPPLNWRPSELVALFLEPKISCNILKNVILIYTLFSYKKVRF